jgi:hypothetical protein
LTLKIKHKDKSFREFLTSENLDQDVIKERKKERDSGSIKMDLAIPRVKT